MLVVFAFSSPLWLSSDFVGFQVRPVPAAMTLPLSFNGLISCKQEYLRLIYEDGWVTAC